MIKFLLVLLPLAIGCSQGHWATDTAGIRTSAHPTPCQKVSGADVVARAMVLSAGAARDEIYSVWPGYRLRVTPLRVVIERDLRMRLSPGQYDVVVSAPFDSSRQSVNTLHPTVLGKAGWLFLTRIDETWMADLDGLVTSSESTVFRSYLGDFASESDFETAVHTALAQCPRVNYFKGEGGVPLDPVMVGDGGGEVDAGR